jgi:uncharacterized phage protein (TIGR02220 family)
MKNKYYWIKLKTDFFKRDDIDYLLSQRPNGSDYVIVYQTICLMTANTDGRLQNTIGNIIRPIDIDKITLECKYIDREIVANALELMKDMGLLAGNDEGVLTVTEYNDIVGCESQWAEKKRAYRDKKKKEGQSGGQSKGQKKDNVLEENKYKSLDKREKSLENKSTEIEIINPAKQDNVPYDDVIDYLNFRLGTHYKSSTDKTKAQIKARFREGFTLDDFKTVIDKKYNEWYGTEMQKYLRPETLFGTNFEGYLNQTSGKKITFTDIGNMVNWEEMYDN